jgi:C4-dicarboxylate-specific signal transduction histidine kinase
MKKPTRDDCRTFDTVNIATQQRVPTLLSSNHFEGLSPKAVMMGQLAASLSHELKQPISAAITDARTCLGWLTRGQPNVEEAREATMRTVKNSNRAAEIIDNLQS